MTKNKTKLSLTTDGTTITVEFDNIDVDLDQYFQAFKTLMIGATFHEKQVEQWIIDEAEIVGEFLEHQTEEQGISYMDCRTMKDLEI